MHSSPLEQHHMCAVWTILGRWGKRCSCSFLQLNCSLNCWDLILCRAAQVMLAVERNIYKNLAQWPANCSMLDFTAQEERGKESWVFIVCQLSISLLESKIGGAGLFFFFTLVNWNKSTADKALFQTGLSGSLVLVSGLWSSCWASFLHIPRAVRVASVFSGEAAWNCLQKSCILSWRPSDISHSSSI